MENGEESCVESRKFVKQDGLWMDVRAGWVTTFTLGQRASEHGDGGCLAGHTGHITGRDNEFLAGHTGSAARHFSLSTA